MAEEKLITSASSVNESLKPTGLEGGEPTCNIRLRVYPLHKKVPLNIVSQQKELIRVVVFQGGLAGYTPEAVERSCGNRIKLALSWLKKAIRRIDVIIVVEILLALAKIIVILYWQLVTPNISHLLKLFSHQLPTDSC